MNDHVQHKMNDERTQSGVACDPVCGMQVEPDAAAGTAEHDGHRRAGLGS